jgi:hypothetical protein
LEMDKLEWWRGALLTRIGRLERRMERSTAAQGGGRRRRGLRGSGDRPMGRERDWRWAFSHSAS